MRLPAVTKEHQQNEDSRQWHERVWASFLAQETIAVPVTPWDYVDVQLRISANTRSFWNTRGYRIRTKTNEEKTILTVWLEQIEAKAPRTKPDQSDQPAQQAWAQPRA